MILKILSSVKDTWKLTWISGGTIWETRFSGVMELKLLDTTISCPTASLQWSMMAASYCGGVFQQLGQGDRSGLREICSESGVQRRCTGQKSDPSWSIHHMALLYALVDFDMRLFITVHHWKIQSVNSMLIAAFKKYTANLPHAS